MPPNHTPRIVIFIILGFAVLAISIAVYLLSSGLPGVTNGIPGPSVSPTPSPTNAMTDTSDWESYRSDEYGYEVRYPTESFITKTSSIFVPHPEPHLNVPTEFIQEIKDIFGGGYLLGPSFSVNKIDNPNNLSIKDWMLLNRSYIVESYEESPREGRIIMPQGIESYHLIREDRGIIGIYAYQENTIFFLHDNFLFSISYKNPPINPTPEWKAHPYYQYLEQSVPITQAIIQSFRFVE